MADLTDQINNIWKGTSLIHRLIFAIVILGLLLGFFGIIYWVREPEYGFLYGDLDQKDAAEIVANLRDNNIPYKVKDKGSSILVPSDKIYEVRMSLAKSGLPGGEVGFELFEQVKFGMSNLAQKVNYRRALQGELAKTISQIEGVEWAKVQIVIPEPSLFIEDEKPSKASVILKIKKSQRLKPQQIDGVIHLVSSSVEGLNAANVTVTDSKGNLLSQIEDSTLSGVVSSQMDLRTKIEDYYASKALNMIEKITGSGDAVVKVSADLDFKHVDEKQTEYDNENKVPVTQTIVSQSTETPQALAGGEGELRSSKEKEETETTQYALSKVERTVSEHVARVKRVTVAVLVNGYYEEEKTEDGGINRKFIKRSDEELKQIASIVKQSIGLNESPPRNDKFEIQCVQFYAGVPFFVDEEGVEKEDKKEFMLEIVKNSSLVIAVIAFLLFAVKALKRVMSPQQKLGYATYSPTELQDGFEGAEEIAPEDISRKKVDKKRIAIRDDIIKSTKGDPRTTSNLVRKWLREGAE